MARYLISFDDGAMDFLEGDLAEVGEAAHTVLRAAKEAGVWPAVQRAAGHIERGGEWA